MHGLVLAVGSGVRVLNAGDEHLSTGEGLLESGDEGNGAALADVDAVPAEGGGQRPVGGASSRSVRGAVEGGTGLALRHGQAGAEGGVGLQVRAQRLQGGLRVLPGRDAHGQARRAGRSQNVARQFQRSDIHADDGQSRLGPQARGEVTAADQLDSLQETRISAEGVLGVVGEVRRGLGPGDQAGHGDIAALVMEGCHQAAHGGHGIQDRTAVLAGVQSMIQDIQAHIDLHDTAQGCGQGRNADLPVGGVRDDDDICGEPVAVGGQEGLERGRADLFLPLDEHGHRAGEPIIRECGERAQGVDVGDDAGAVVGGAAAEEALPAALRGEGIGLGPGGWVANGLDVVVGVEEHAGSPGDALAVGQHRRAPHDAIGPLNAEDLGVQAGAAQQIGDVLRAAAHLGLIMAGGRHRGDGDELHQIGDDGLEGLMDG